MHLYFILIYFMDQLDQTVNYFKYASNFISFHFLFDIIFVLICVYVFIFVFMEDWMLEQNCCG